jgi:uncharacterized membrane protein YvbJ
VDIQANYCHSCGNKIVQNSNFCSICGVKQLVRITIEEKKTGAIPLEREKKSGEIKSFKLVKSIILILLCFFVYGFYKMYSESQKFDSSTNSVNDLISSTPTQNVDICRCLTEPGNSNYMMENGKACNKAISNAIGVEDWRKVNMSQNPFISQRFDGLANRCR